MEIISADFWVKIKKRQRASAGLLQEGVDCKLRQWQAILDYFIFMTL